ncbi:hypothetical protein EJ04DRAFT_585138, partial [Polyplosphaeria fusca]
GIKTTISPSAFRSLAILHASSTSASLNEPTISNPLFLPSFSTPLSANLINALKSSRSYMDLPLTFKFLTNEVKVGYFDWLHRSTSSSLKNCPPVAFQRTENRLHMSRSFCSCRGHFKHNIYRSILHHGGLVNIKLPRS